MIQVDLRLCASGATFSPARAAAEFDLKPGGVQHEPGEVASYGPHRGRPRSSGYACFQIYPSSPTVDPATARVDADLVPHDLPLFEQPGLIEGLRRHGATDIVLHVDVAYDAQCNLEFSARLLRALADLAIPFTMTCYEDAESFASSDE